MSSILRWIARIAALLGGLGLAPAFSQAFPPDPRVDSIFSRWERPDSPGCSLAVDKAGTTIYSRGYGTADLDHGVPNTPATVFHAASLAKQFTAMAVMLLVNSGRLTLDADVRDYVSLPDFGTPPKRITISHLLHQVSGIRDQWALHTMAGWRMSDDVITRDDVLNLVGRMKALNFDPGTGFSYSNTNYTLAGLIVEKVGGVPLPEFVRQHIFEPLGMKSTTLTAKHGQVVKDRAYGYRGVYPNFETRMPNYDLTGPTNLLTTVEDLIKWGRNFDSKIVGGDAAVAAMQATLPESGSYGLGLFVRHEHGQLVVEHDGRDAGYRAHLIRWPQQQLMVALLCNVALPENTSTPTLVREVGKVFQTHEAAEYEVAAAAAPAAALADFVGEYHSDEIDATYQIAVGSPLKLTRKKYPPVELTKVGTDRFTIKDFSAGVAGALTAVTLRFTRDAQGKVSGFVLDDDNPFKRVLNFSFVKTPQ